MPFFLKNRELSAKELMDYPDCDKQLLFNTYNQFSTINKHFAGWKKIYTQWMKPYFQSKGNQGSILDVGCGGGDVLLYLAQLAEKDGLTLHLHGIEPDANALDFIKTKTFPSNIHFSQNFLKDLLNKDQRYDFIISNNIIHHLPTFDFITMLNDAELLCNKMIIFNDLARSDIAFIAYKILSHLLYRNSFAIYDGSLSIRRAYTKSELIELLPSGWQVKSAFPYRNIIYKDKT